MLDRFNRFVDDHAVVYYALVALVLVVAGLLVDGRLFAALGHALGEALRQVR